MPLHLDHSLLSIQLSIGMQWGLGIFLLLCSNLKSSKITRSVVSLVSRFREELPKVELGKSPWIDLEEK